MKKHVAIPLASSEALDRHRGIGAWARTTSNIELEEFEQETSRLLDIGISMMISLTERYLPDQTPLNKHRIAVYRQHLATFDAYLLLIRSGLWAQATQLARTLFEQEMILEVLFKSSPYQYLADNLVQQRIAFEHKNRADIYHDLGVNKDWGKDLRAGGEDVAHFLEAEKRLRSETGYGTISTIPTNALPVSLKHHRAQGAKKMNSWLYGVDETGRALVFWNVRSLARFLGKKKQKAYRVYYHLWSAASHGFSMEDQIIKIGGVNPSPFTYAPLRNPVLSSYVPYALRYGLSSVGESMLTISRYVYPKNTKSERKQYRSQIRNACKRAAKKLPTYGAQYRATPLEPSRVAT